WDESIEANRASAEASRAYAAMRHRDATEAEELHALDYLAYSYLQQAEDAKAKKLSTSQQKFERRTRSWNSARLMRSRQYLRVMHWNATIGGARRHWKFRKCPTGL